MQVRVEVVLPWRSILRLWLCPRWARHLIRDLIVAQASESGREVVRHG
jgi:hypothetical protein